jgi:DNA-directed RNA polymerase specialized sigma24 family protein
LPPICASIRSPTFLDDPQDRALQRERTTLAFLVALQHLTPAQRAILLLREVLEWPASEVGDWLNLSVPAVNGSLAFGLYQREAEADVYQLFSLVVLYVVGE